MFFEQGHQPDTRALSSFSRFLVSDFWNFPHLAADLAMEDAEYMDLAMFLSLSNLEKMGRVEDVEDVEVAKYSGDNFLGKPRNI